MLDSKKLAQNLFRVAVNVVKGENTFLRGHCEADGYYGITSVSEPVLMHLIFRTLVTRGLYDVRLAQPYPGHPNLVADLVVVQDNVWAACLHAKWFATNAKVGSAKDAMESMRTKLRPDVAKFLLGLWVKEPPYAKAVDGWIAELAEASRSAATWSDTFTVLSSGAPVTDVSAGLTLYEVV